MSAYTLESVGFIRSIVKGREDPPSRRLRRGRRAAPGTGRRARPASAKARVRQARGFLLRRGYSATGEIEPRFAETLLGMEVGHELIVITWLHEAKRDVLKGHPRNDPNRPLTGAAKPARAASGDRARD
jgi:hypothetical protein